MDNATAGPDHPLLHVPRYITDWPSWAAWTVPVKMPLDLRRGLRKASTDMPDTWAAWPAASAYLAKAANYAPPAIPLKMGVGILVAPPLVFVDFDDLLPEDQEDPQAADWAESFLQRCADQGAYTEWSGSGTGAHALVRVTPSFPTLTRNRYTRSGPHGPVGIELYSGKRFAALTGFSYFPGVRPELNDPRAGDDLLTAFIADLGVSGAPILSQPLGPISVPHPTETVLQLARDLADVPDLRRAFEDPTAQYADFAARREKKSMDSSLSAWRFHLYSVAARNCHTSPLPLYELFNPKRPDHEGRHPVEEWQVFSGYLRKKHRVYSDIQRAHALIVEEQRLLALDLGEPPPPPPSRTQAPRHPANVDLVQSWAQLGLVMKTTKSSAVPVSGSANYARCIAKHHHFQQWRIERNQIDGTTAVNRQPITDTLATRFLEPLRAVLDMGSDPPVQAVRDAIEVVADDSPFDPLQEYLRSLPTYDIHSEESFLSTWLEKVGATRDADTERYSRRILLGLVARALKPGIKFDYVPVFEGPTGVGKSTLVSMLVTDPYFAVLSQDLQSKDAKIALRGKWGLELAEMSAFKKTDEESRKAFFSTPFDSFRPPYGRANIDVMRRCVLFGTTEDKQYLSDWRGNRRFWPVRFEGELDLKWFAAHRDRLFAEALHYFEAGERIYDTQTEMHDPERLKALSERLVTPAWQVRLLEHLEALPGPEAPGELEEEAGRSGLLRTQDVANLQRLLDLPQAVQSMSDAQLASFLRRSGYHQVVLSFRHGGASKKAYFWGHPSLVRLTEEQKKAFFSLFPALFPDSIAPQPWIESRVDHLPGALRHLSPIE